jgi:hypothetical protein
MISRLGDLILIRISSMQIMIFMELELDWNFREKRVRS